MAITINWRASSSSSFVPIIVLFRKVASIWITPDSLNGTLYCFELFQWIFLPTFVELSRAFFSANHHTRKRIYMRNCNRKQFITFCHFHYNKITHWQYKKKVFPLVYILFMAEINFISISFFFCLNILSYSSSSILFVSYFFLAK